MGRRGQGPSGLAVSISVPEPADVHALEGEIRAALGRLFAFDDHKALCAQVKNFDRRRVSAIARKAGVVVEVSMHSAGENVVLEDGREFVATERGEWVRVLGEGES